MVTYLLDKELPFGPLYNFGSWAFKLFWREILEFAHSAAVVLDNIDIVECYVKFVLRNGKAVAYLVRHYFNGKIGRIEIEEIDVECCPDEVQKALKEGNQVRVYNIK